MPWFLLRYLYERPDATVEGRWTIIPFRRGFDRFEDAWAARLSPEGRKLAEGVPNATWAVVTAESRLKALVEVQFRLNKGRWWRWNKRLPSWWPEPRGGSFGFGDPQESVVPRRPCPGGLSAVVALPIPSETVSAPTLTLPTPWVVDSDPDERRCSRRLA